MTADPDDLELIQIVDAALIDVARRSGRHLVCRPGCAQCCTGTFAINALDVERLRAGFLLLEKTQPERARTLASRINVAIAETSASFPGDAHSGILGQTDEQRAWFEDFGNDQVCPVLDPLTHTCDLYTSRPLTCRVFGPPVRTAAGMMEDGAAEAFGICELCFTDATAEEIAACELIPDPDNLEARLLQRKLDENGDAESFRPEAESTVAFAFASWFRARS